MSANRLATFLGIAFGLISHFGLCMAESPCITETCSNEPTLAKSMMVIVETNDWLLAVRQIVKNEAEVHFWKNDRPDWFQCDTAFDQKVLILVDPFNQQLAKELWRERLTNQGCRLCPVKLERSQYSANQSDLLRSIHGSVVNLVPEKKLIWDANLSEALDRVQKPRSTIYHNAKNITNSW